MNIRSFSRVQLKLVSKDCGSSMHGDRTRRRVLIPAPSPESMPEQSHRAEHDSTTRNHPLFPAAEQRGRSPEHAMARGLPVGIAAVLPTTFSYTRFSLFLADLFGQSIGKHMLSIPSFKETLKRTISRCPQCKKPAPAEIWKTKGSPAKVFLSRTCPEHGESTACISSDARFYWLAKGDPSNACGPACACSSDPSGLPGTLGRNADATDPSVEILSTCLALIEIVDSCNLACPTCFADSPTGAAGEKLKTHSLESLQSRIRGVIDRKGNIEILQLSGGEPTLHPQFFKLVDWIHEQPEIDYCLVNTNGVRIAKEDDFLKERPPFPAGKFPALPPI